MDRVELLATVLTIMGFYLISEGHIAGFIISLVSNVLWIVWGSLNKAYGIVVVNACLSLASINGIIHVMGV